MDMCFYFYENGESFIGNVCLRDSWTVVQSFCTILQLHQLGYGSSGFVAPHHHQDLLIESPRPQPHSTGVEQYFVVVLMWISFITTDVEPLFMCLFLCIWLIRSNFLSDICYKYFLLVCDLTCKISYWQPLRSEVFIVLKAIYQFVCVFFAFILQAYLCIFYENLGFHRCSMKLICSMFSSPWNS